MPLTTLLAPLRRRRSLALMLMAGALGGVSPLVSPLAAQSRVGRDSSARLTRYGHDLLYDGVKGLGYTAYDHVRNKPEEWGKGWPGYGRRLASHTGELVISETTTETLAALMNRPLDYESCRCTGTVSRVQWAVLASFTDITRGGRMLAVPRLVGTFAGNFAQATWQPDSEHTHIRSALTSSAMSLVIRSGVNLYREYRHPAVQAR